MVKTGDLFKYIHLRIPPVLASGGICSTYGGREGGPHPTGMLSSVYFF